MKPLFFSSLILILNLNATLCFLQPSKLLNIIKIEKYTPMSMSLAMKSARCVGKLSPKTSAFFLCDIQDRFRPLIHHSETIISTAKYLTSVAKNLEIPILVTEQYSKVFGQTVHDCFENGEEDYKDLLNKGRVFEKKKFSMCTEQLMDYYNTQDDFKNRDSIILFGIESHVCVQQTCLDLLEMGKDVHLIVDGVSSQQTYDREISLSRMANAGAYLTTAQSAAFMLMGSADHNNFKAVSKLTVEHMKLPNEFNNALITRK